MECVGHHVIHFARGEALAAPFDSRRRDVEGGYVKAQRCQRFGIIAETATDDKAFAPAAGHRIFFQPIREIRIYLPVRPGKRCRIALRFIVQNLKPAVGRAFALSLFRQLSRTLPCLNVIAEFICHA